MGITSLSRGQRRSVALSASELRTVRRLTGMATIDEQRKRFEKWFIDIVLRRTSEPGQWFGRDDVGGYIDPTVHDMWRGYVAGEQARDAEVQALREALIEIRDGLEWVYMDRRAEDSFLRALRQAGRALRQVDAALAGGKGNQDE